MTDCTLLLRLPALGWLLFETIHHLYLRTGRFWSARFVTPRGLAWAMVADLAALVILAAV